MFNHHHHYKNNNGDEVETLSSSNSESKSGPDHHFTVVRSDDTKKVELLQAVKVGDYLKAVPKLESNWMIQNWIPYGYLAILSGNSKSGKTTFLTALALSVSRGTTFMGMPTVQGNVLWVALEESQIERADCLRKHGCTDDEPFYIVHNSIRIDDKDSIESLRATVKAHNIKLIVIDPLYLATGAQTLTDGRQARSAFQPLKDLVNDLGVAAILIHHFTKNVGSGLVRERAADSNQLLALASMDMIMDVKVIGGIRQITLRSTGRGTFANFDWVIDSSSETSFEKTFSGTLGSSGRRDPKELIVALLEMEPGKKHSASDIAQKLSMTVETVRNKMKGMVDASLVARTTIKGKAYYTTPAPVISKRVTKS